MLVSAIEIHRRAFSCQGMVHSLAWQFSRRLTGKVDLEELVSEGQVGLLKAARDFDSTRGAGFGTYAYWRIRGSMLDWIRSQRWYDTADFLSGRLADDQTQQHQNDSPPAINALSIEVEDLKATDPAVTVSENEVRDVLRGLIEKLDGLPKQILNATVINSQTLEDAGKSAGVHKGTAQRAQVRGFEQLAKAIEDRGLGVLQGEELRKLVFKSAPPRQSG